MTIILKANSDLQYCSIDLTDTVVIPVWRSIIGSIYDYGGSVNSFVHYILTHYGPHIEGVRDASILKKLQLSDPAKLTSYTRFAQYLLFIYTAYTLRKDVARILQNDTRLHEYNCTTFRKVHYDDIPLTITDHGQYYWFWFHNFIPDTLFETDLLLLLTSMQ